VDPEILHQKRHTRERPMFNRANLEFGVDAPGGLPCSVSADQPDRAELTGLRNADECRLDRVEG
jgi:hypothetical protein